MDAKRTRARDGRIGRRGPSAPELAAQLDAVLSCVPDGVLVCGVDGRVQRANAAACALLGWTTEALDLAGPFDRPGEQWLDEHGRDLRPEETPVAIASSGGAVVDRLLERRAGARSQWFRVSASALRGAGAPVGVVVSLSDVTALRTELRERARAEAALREAVEAAELERNRLSAILDALPAGLAIADATGRISRFNEALARIWGRPPSPKDASEYGEWRGRWVGSGAPIAAEDWAMARALRTGEVVPGDIVEIEKFDGTGTATIINAAAPVHDHAGRVIGGVVAELDITAQKRIEDQLRESEARYRTLFTNMTEGFALGEVVEDDAGCPCDVRFLEMNGAFEVQSGLAAATTLGRPMREVLPDLEQSWIDTYCEVAHGGPARRFERWAEPLGRCFSVYTFSPQPGRFATLFTDVTEQK
ncbi:PAS domain-containing protein, partial [Myxococcota bacterium]|nr:PAS domain-containing protein [Myxococcota bacterium]